MNIAYFQDYSSNWSHDNQTAADPMMQMDNYGYGMNPIYSGAAITADPNLSNQQSTQKCGKISARNQLKGTVTKVTEGSVNSVVEVDIGCGHTITSIITMASLKDLGIQVGSTVTAIVKSSDVILMS